MTDFFSIQSNAQLVSLLQKVGLVAAAVLPLWNIPLIIKIIKRKTSSDLSLVWVFGIWSCILLMLPSSLLSADIVFKVSIIFGFISHSVVVFIVMLYRKEPNRGAPQEQTLDKKE